MANLPYVRFPSARGRQRGPRAVVGPDLSVRSERDVLIEFFTWAAANWKRLEHTTIGDAVDLYLKEQKP